MNRPTNVAHINTEIRNRLGSAATAMFQGGNSPTGVRVEARKYHDRGTLTYVWEASYVSGDMERYCLARTLCDDTLELTEPRIVPIEVPIRASTTTNIRNVISIPKQRKQLLWNRVAGLLLSCAWRVWDTDTEVIVSLVKDSHVIPVLSYDGVDVFEV